MRAMAILTCCWPGLAELWFRGRWSGLIVAVTFGALLNLALAVSFVWPDLAAPLAVLLGWIVVVSIWCVSARRTIRRLPELYGNHPDAARENLFLQAQGEYLKGHWLEAETVLLRLLGGHPRDIEARLMLATTYRHSRQVGAANKQLEILSKTDGAEAWAVEIATEEKLLQRITSQDEQQQAP